MKEQILKLQEVFAKAKGVRVELGLVDDLKKDVQNAKSKVESAERLHKAAEKDNNQLNKLNSEWIDLKAKAQRVAKLVKEFMDLGKSQIKEANADLSKSKKNAEKVEQSLKDLGLDKKIISSEISEIQTLEKKLKSLDFAFFR
jgi:predicted  nucleic acid-binding Zn-ribbon protein